MIDWVLAFRFNSLLAVGLYWVPLFLCAIGYSVRLIKEVRKDKEDRAECRKGSYNYYHPSVTIGTIVFYALVSIAPGTNLVALVLHIGYDMLASVFEAIGKVLDKPLVPK
jgi:hypothetical protein